MSSVPPEKQQSWAAEGVQRKVYHPRLPAADHRVTERQQLLVLKPAWGFYWKRSDGRFLDSFLFPRISSHSKQ